MTTILSPRGSSFTILDAKALAELDRTVVFLLPLKVAKKAKPVSEITRYWGEVNDVSKEDGDVVFELILWNVTTGESFFLNYTLGCQGYYRKGRRPCVGDAVSVLIWYEGDDLQECIHLEVIKDSPQMCVESRMTKQACNEPQG